MSTNQDKNFFLNLFDSPSPNNTEINQKEPVKMINENSVLSTIVTLIIIFYGSLSAPKLPPLVENIIKTPIVKIIIYFFIIYEINKNPSVSIALAIVFTLL